MGKEKVEGKFELDPWFEGLRRTLTRRITSDLVIPRLIDNQLLSSEGKAQISMTGTGIEELLRNVVHGVNIALSQTRLDIPRGSLFDEIEITDKVLEGLGEVDLNIEGNRLSLRFTGEDPMITSIKTPLDVNADISSQAGGEKPTSFVDIRPLRITE